MSRFKTELCNNLIELGTCKYGDRCHYAHGHHELRQVSRRHPKYRTEKCKNFELTGKCPFGPRCSYVHPKPDLDSMIEQLSKYMKHTKAPKPDSEDDEDPDVSFFTTRIRTSPPSAAAVAAASAAVAAAATASVNNTSIVRTPLGSNNSSNILSSMNFSNLTIQTNLQQSTLNNQQTTPILQVNDQINGNTSNNKQLLNTPDISTCSRSIYNNNFSFYESTNTTFESNKKPSFIQTNSSNSNITASNPFGIRNPLSDYINNTNINGKSPLQPNKQFYTRF